MYRSGNVEVEAAEPIEEGNTYKIEMKRLGLRGELRVNGKKAASKTRLAPFQAGTDLFVGGLPPGVSPHRRLNGVAPLNGCVYKVCDHYLISVYIILLLFMYAYQFLIILSHR